MHRLDIFLRRLAGASGAALGLLAGCHVEVTPVNSEPPPHEGTGLATPAQARDAIAEWVPVGTPVAEAVRVMQRHGYACAIKHSAHFGTETDLDYVRCYHSYGGPMVSERWLVALIFADDKIVRLEATTEMVGP